MDADHPAPHPPTPRWLWDVFCRVIDNHGDLGVLWRLSRQLARQGHRVRLWVDDASALAWMAPQHDATDPGIQVLPWSLSEQPQAVANLPAADVWVEGFGCEISEIFIAETNHQSSAEDQKSFKKPAWINLEYLTAEPYAERCHRLPSPVMSGPARGWTKHFFYPGFSPATGGLLREPDLPTRQAAFDRGAWLASQGLPWAGERLVSLFCYEPPALPGLLQMLAAQPRPHTLLVAHGRPAAAVRQAWRTLDWPTPVAGANGRTDPIQAQHGALTVFGLPPLTQTDYDHLLWACDWNFVRGEDSLVRALWAGKPLVWHIYPQDDDAHHAKLQAFLDRLTAPASVRQWHTWWNAAPPDDPAPSPPSQPLEPVLAEAGIWAEQARKFLMEQTDLARQLVAWTEAVKANG